MDLCTSSIYVACMLQPPAPADRVRILDLFAGAGGLSEGFVRAEVPHRSVGAVEMDVAAAATFAQNHGGDVYAGSIEAWLREEEVPTADVLVGGPPCQGFSQLGKRDSADERNGLWRHYAETIRLAKPRYFVMENVPRFLTSPERALMEEATGTGGMLSDYAFEARVLNSADFGAPQSRKRAIVIGHHRDLEFPGFPQVSHPPHGYATVRDVIADLPGEVDQLLLPDRSVIFAGRTLPGVFVTSELHLSRDYRPQSQRRFAHIPVGGNRFDLPLELQAKCWQRHRSGSADVMGRLRWDRPSVTIRTEFFKPEKGRYLHPTANRAITHHEAARLQGFPDSYKWVGSKVAIARQIGNAVPVPLAAALAKQIADHFELRQTADSTASAAGLPWAV